LHPSTRKLKGFGPLLAALALLIFTLCCQAPTSATSAQNVCIGLGGWPCGYTGPFPGEYYAGYSTLGCTPVSPNSTCVVPQIAIETSYLVINRTTYVINWANETRQPINQLVDGSTVAVSGRLDAIFYNTTAGSTYTIYYSNAKGLWKPQPPFQIENATLVTQSVTSTCTTTLTFTVIGEPNGTWNLPMIPSGACFTATSTTQQSQTTGTMEFPAWAVILASTSAALVVAGTIVSLIKRRKEDTLGRTQGPV